MKTEEDYLRESLSRCRRLLEAAAAENERLEHRINELKAEEHKWQELCHDNFVRAQKAENKVLEMEDRVETIREAANKCIEDEFAYSESAERLRRAEAEVKELRKRRGELIRS